MLWLFLLLAVSLVVGSALMLLRTAKMPKIPPTVKSQPYDADDD